ncbi:hypothetical protein [Hydrogenophaga sp. 2FB]|uniref:hypothetical protein n=1 Tax=Hydrogenophaga sp. 2FB TaxID=2502187 RepID=UPI0010F723D5|nr:hypothetical protein [Hydrogenophaga sp. 2FB]
MKRPPFSSPRGEDRPHAEARAAKRDAATDKNTTPAQGNPYLMLDSAYRSAICNRYVQKLNGLQDTLVQDSSLIMERMLKLPPTQRDGVVRELGKKHILQVLLQPQGGRPGAWKALAGLDEGFDGLSADDQASRLIWREMEVIVKSATDLTKTEAEYNLLIQRMQEYKNALSRFRFSQPGGAQSRSTSSGRGF